MEVIPWILAVTDCISTCESCRDYNGCCGSNRSVSTSLVPMELRVWSLKQASRGSGERTLSIILCSVSLSKRGPRTKQSPAARQLWRWSCGFTSTWIRLDIIPAKRKKKHATGCFLSFLCGNISLCCCLSALWIEPPPSYYVHWKKMASKYKLLEYLCRWVISY